MTNETCEAIQPSTPGINGKTAAARNTAMRPSQFWRSNFAFRRSIFALLSFARAEMGFLVIYTSRRFWIPNRPCGRRASRTTIMMKAVAVLKWDPR